MRLGTSCFLLLPQGCTLTPSYYSDLHQDVVDGDVNELHKVADEAHDGEPHCRCQGDLLELCMGFSWRRVVRHVLVHALVQVAIPCLYTHLEITRSIRQYVAGKVLLTDTASNPWVCRRGDNQQDH